jgi:pimeloyl-ACP methyl ester carboxylesterase
MSTKKKRGVKGWLKLIAKSLLVILFIAFWVAWTWGRFIDATVTDGWIKQNLGTRKLKPTVHYLTYNNRNVRWLELGDTTKPVTILIHGAPSSMAGWRGYLADTSIISKVCLVAIDRPGYGKSDFGNPETSVLAQAKAILPIIKKYAKRGKGVRIVGSSYGCTIAVRLAMLKSEYIKELVLISGSTKPEAEKTFWISYPLDYPLLNWIVPPLLNVASKEKLSHPEELRKMLPYWKDITCKVTIVHGTKDDLIYYENALFTQQMLKHNKQVRLITVKNAGHYLPWRRIGMVRKLILGKKVE